ncbi:hypothetical protein BWI96_18015 [Siphonobacter sp. SORGH_AS_0500]|nr:hypothetical protein BWI96_18015 [Siphonobacter sp. SORGH_AS_0500]
MVLGLLCSLPTLATPVDSILVRIGPKSKVLFYSPSREELKKLENYDWNTILKDLNARLSETTRSEPRQHYIDLSGKSFLSDSSLRSVNSLVKVSQQERDQAALVTTKKLKSNLEFIAQSLSFRFGFADFANIPADRPNSWFGLYQTMYQSQLSRSYNYAVGVSMYSGLIQKKDWSFVLRWGAEVDIKRYFWNRSFTQPVNKITTNISTLQAPIVPTIRFYDSSGKLNYSYGFGFYAGFQVAIKDRLIAKSEGIDYTLRNEYNKAFKYGLILNAGYKKFGFYGQYELGSKREYLLNRTSRDLYHYRTSFGNPPKTISFGITYNGF